MSGVTARRRGRAILAALWMAAGAALGCAAGGSGPGLAGNNPGPVQHMREVASVNVAPGADDAVVVFLRPQGTTSPTQASLFEVVDRQPPALIGIVAAMKKVAYRATPGRHLFMAIGEEADFITANLEAGKLYYVLLMLEQGSWKPNFSLQPVRADEHGQLTERLARTRWVETTPDSFAWARDHAGDIEAKRFKYYGIWRRKPSFERLALFPDDGR